MRATDPGTAMKPMRPRAAMTTVRPRAAITRDGTSVTSSRAAAALRVRLALLAARAGAGLGAALLLGIALLAVACGEQAQQPSAPAGEPSITGVVAAARPAAGEDAVGWFFIEQGRGDHDKAAVTVTGDTAWYRRSGDGYATVTPPAPAALNGMTVAVQFTGPVAESYPVQATAGWVVLTE